MKARNAALVIAVSLAVNGCAVQKRGDSAGSAGSDVSQVCSPAVVGIGAALVCAALAKGNNRVRTGAACAAVAVTACYLANSYKAEQIRTAKQVEDAIYDEESAFAPVVKARLQSVKQELQHAQSWMVWAQSEADRLKKVLEAGHKKPSSETAPASKRGFGKR